VEMGPMMESSGRDEEQVASDHDEDVLLLPMHTGRSRRTLHADSDDGASMLPDLARAILPEVLQNFIRALIRWLQGPPRPEKQHIRSLQFVPRWLEDKLSIKREVLFVTATFLAWAVFFFAVVWRWSLLPDLPRYGQPLPIPCMQQAW
jgi:hypothetical protein